MGEQMGSQIFVLQCGQTYLFLEPLLKVFVVEDANGAEISYVFEVLRLPLTVTGLSHPL
jgi:uncharacterized integral membrane protein